jgi:hypothetical protein
MKRASIAKLHVHFQIVKTVDNFKQIIKSLVYILFIASQCTQENE